MNDLEEEYQWLSSTNTVRANARIRMKETFVVVVS